MKKVLEAELLSIAHRILQMKNKDDVNKLYIEAKEVYEKLSILKFYENNINIIKSDLSQEELENKIEQAYSNELVNEELSINENEEIIAEVESVIQEQLDEINKDLSFKTDTEEEFLQYEEEVILPETEVNTLVGEELEISIDTKIELKEEEFDIASSFSLEDTSIDIKKDEDILEIEEPLNQHLINHAGIEMFLDLDEDESTSDIENSLFGINYNDVEFVEVKQTTNEHELVNETEQELFSIDTKADENLNTTTADKKHSIDRPLSINDSYSKFINLALNDRIAFEKYLFDGSSEDLNRVLSQLNTMESLEDAHSFIENLVKPDYNFWEGKDEYAARLMELIEKRFF